MDDTMVELHTTVKAETTVADSAVSSDKSLSHPAVHLK